MILRIAFGCDHRALVHKRHLMSFADAVGHKCTDLGCFDEAPVNYPDVARMVSEAVTSGQHDQGVLICGTGLGMSIAANKLKGIRAALCHNTFTASRARQHNNANVLCLGAEVVDTQTAEQILLTYLNGSFEGGRHSRRLEIVSQLECHDFP